MARRKGYGAVRAFVYLLLGLIAGFPARATPVAPVIWAFGDSLTAGYGLPPADGFPAQLQAGLRRGGLSATVRNGGVAGDTTAQGKARLRWGLRGLGTPPDLVIVEFGGNDMLRGLPPEVAEANLDAILTELGRRRIPTLLVGMRAAPNLGEAYRARFDSLYARLAARHRVAFYPFFLDGVVGHRDLFQADGIHANARGVRIIVSRIAPAVRKALAAPRP
ncbi:arylesterase [Sphingomonas sp.]|uniref:arylesterase n=1 Tax=Sphingomonas sp. TaxID=28214 RepID=UPI000DB755B3|nr:arylesterase [Sphingomonas sp.]PZU08055.1 MAG: arylesterase [Sphingomonas sp.]